jgi:hypothetical protein
MTAKEIENDSELQHVLWACYRYWQGEVQPPPERSICYSWVLRLHQERFGTKFHQSSLRRLMELGFLKQDDTSRSGHRRYYRIIDPQVIENLLRKWGIAIDS